MMVTYNRPYGILESYRVDDFWAEFPEKKKRVLIHKLDTSQPEKRKYTFLTGKDYRRIIVAYLKIWLTEFYRKKINGIYFPFSGMVKLCNMRIRNKLRLSYLWYMFPGKSLFMHVELRRNPGANYYVNKLGKEFEETNDIALLPNQRKEFARYRRKPNNYFAELPLPKPR